MAIQTRTAYPVFLSQYSPQELEILFKPSADEVEFTRRTAREGHGRVMCLMLLKGHQHLGYFPALPEIPKPVLDYVCECLSFSEEFQECHWIQRTAERLRKAIRDRLGLRPFSLGGEALLDILLARLAHTMSDPADLINASIDELVRNNYTLPAFGRIHRKAMQARSQAHEQIYGSVGGKLSGEDRQELDALLQKPSDGHITPFSLMKKPPGPSTLSRMKDWRRNIRGSAGCWTPTACLPGSPSPKSGSSRPRPMPWRRPTCWTCSPCGGIACWPVWSMS